MLFSIYKEAFIEYRKNFKYFVIPMLLLIGSSTFHVYGLPALSYLSQPFQFILSKSISVINYLIPVPIIIIAALSHKQIKIDWKIIKKYTFYLWWRFLFLDCSVLIIEILIRELEALIPISLAPIVALARIGLIALLDFIMLIGKIEMIDSFCNIRQAFRNLNYNLHHQFFKLIGHTILLCIIPYLVLLGITQIFYPRF